MRIIAGWLLAYLSRVVIIPSALPLWIDLRLDTRGALVHGIHDDSLGGPLRAGACAQNLLCLDSLNTVLKQDARGARPLADAA